MAANVNFEVLTAQARSGAGPLLPVEDSIAKVSATATTTPSSAPVSIAADRGDIWSITVDGGNAYVAFAKSGANAGASPRKKILAGQTRYCVAMVNGETPAIMDAP